MWRNNTQKQRTRSHSGAERCLCLCLSEECAPGVLLLRLGVDEKTRQLLLVLGPACACFRRGVRECVRVCVKYECCSSDWLEVSDENTHGIYAGTH